MKLSSAPATLSGFGGGASVSMLRGEDSVRCLQGATRVQRAAEGGGGGGSRITSGEDSGRGGRSAEAELTSNRGLVLRREGQRGWRGRVVGLHKESGGFHKKKESKGRRRRKARQQRQMRKKRFRMSYSDKRKHTMT
jgi:hypothetical protein